MEQTTHSLIFFGLAPQEMSGQTFRFLERTQIWGRTRYCNNKVIGLN